MDHTEDMMDQGVSGALPSAALPPSGLRPCGSQAKPAAANAHTPGPWLYIDATKSAAMKYSQSCVIRAGDKQVASFSWNDRSPWFPTKAESQANARLIAAAPELLSELEALVAAVRFADPPKMFNGVECHEARVPVAFIEGAEAAIAKAEGR